MNPERISIFTVERRSTPRRGHVDFCLRGPSPSDETWWAQWTWPTDRTIVSLVLYGPGEAEHTGVLDALWIGNTQHLAMPISARGLVDLGKSPHPLPLPDVPAGVAVRAHIVTPPPNAGP